MSFGDFLLDFFGGRVVLKRELADFVLDKRGRFIYQATTTKDNGTHNVGAQSPSLYHSLP